MDLEHYNHSIQESNGNNLRDLFSKYGYHWKWFVISIFVALTLGFVYLRYQTPIYEVNATILIKDDKKGGVSDELSAFEDLGILKSNKNIDNEIEILKSRSLMTRVVKELALNVTYYSYGRPVEHERFKETPILVKFVSLDSAYSEPQGNWVLVPLSNERFILKSGKDEKVLGEYNFGDAIPAYFGKFVFTRTKYFSDSDLNKNFRVVTVSTDDAVNRCLGSLKVNPVNKNSNAITVGLRDPLPDRASAIVDDLIKQHNLDAIADKNEISQNTANFINERIDFITSELSLVEGEAEDFKVKYKLTDVVSEAKLFLESGSESEMSLVDANTQVYIAEFMLDYIKNHDSSMDLIPANMGLADAALSAQINDYNKLVLERNVLARNASAKNPVVENLESKINVIRGSIKEGLLNLQKTLQIKAKEIAKKEKDISSKISSVPKYERQYRTIQRQQQIKEALYLYLLQKREETNIALAVTIANAKIIDAAYCNGIMVAPKKQIIYFSSFLIGLFLPILVLYVIDLLDTKVHNRKDTDFVNIPYLGDIPLAQSKNKLVVLEADKSNVAEAFRLLRTNVEFLAHKAPGENRTIFVTSTIGKEGKSFIALNLATSFSLSGKKTLLIGTDLRVPTILAYLKLDDKKGVTNFIMDRQLPLEDIIFQMPDFPYLSIIPSGPIPPNPAEQLMHPRVQELFEAVKADFEYVVVDTAPVGLVTDTLLISNFADCTVFVARANYLDKRMLHIAETLHKEKRLPNMAAVINCTDGRNGYGYGYGKGYGYGQAVSKKWWKTLSWGKTV